MNNSSNGEFAVLDRVVHPAHGPGLITAVEQMDAAIAGFRRYYVIDIYEQNLTVRVPVRRADRVGLRSVMSSERVSNVLQTLRSEPNSLPDDYKRRQATVRERIKVTRPVELAEVIRDLFWHGEKDHLTSVDTQLLRASMDRLAWEMACAAGSTPGDSLEQINLALGAPATNGHAA
ncbi:MAG: CarD family transcriptional regulator [Caldilineales bacterium]